MVTAAEISEQFDLLLQGRRSRAAVEAWAEERAHAADERRLTYEPPADEPRLWRALTYLLGVGLEVAPGEFLHGLEDFVAFRREVSL